MAVRTFVLLSGALVALASAGVRAQDIGEPTIRAIPDPAADLPAAVTKDISLPDTAAATAGTHSEAGRSGERRDAGLAKARDAAANGLDHSSNAGNGDDVADQDTGTNEGHDGLATARGEAADAAADGLATAADAVARGADFGHDVADAAQTSREDFGHNHAPDSLPDQVPTDVPPADHAPPDVPGPPATPGP
jgi:hypothetical protein